MSLFELFKSANNVVTLVCEKSKDTDEYNCKLGFDYESFLMRTNGYKHKGKYSKSDLTNFIEKDLSAKKVDLLNTKGWVVLDEHNDIHINYFGNDDENEIHITKARNRYSQY